MDAGPRDERIRQLEAENAALRLFEVHKTRGGPRDTLFGQRKLCVTSCDRHPALRYSESRSESCCWLLSAKTLDLIVPRVEAGLAGHLAERQEAVGHIATTAGFEPWFQQQVVEALGGRVISASSNGVDLVLRYHDGSDVEVELKAAADLRTRYLREEVWAKYGTRPAFRGCLFLGNGSDRRNLALLKEAWNGIQLLDHRLFPAYKRQWVVGFPWKEPNRT